MNDHGHFLEKEETYVNDAGVTMIAHLADDSWNVDAADRYADHIGGRGHSGHVGRAYDRSHVCRGHCRSRVYGHGQSLSGSPFCQVRDSVSQIVYRHGDNRLFLAHPSQNERDRACFWGEVDFHVDGKSHRRVGATVAVEIFEEIVDVCLEEGDLEGPQSRAWVGVEE